MSVMWNIKNIPLVSIILPVRNEEGCLEQCLKSLLVQDYQNICEILVVDGCSIDGSRTIAERIATQSPLVRVRDNPKIGQAAALNIGIQAARGDVIVRVDAHAVYERDYVSQCVHHLKTTGAANVGGPMRVVRRSGIVGDAIAFCHTCRFGIGVARFHSAEEEGYVDTVWLGAVWKRVFETVGHFDETSYRTEDNEFNHRLRAAGHKIFLTPRIKSLYFPRETFRAFWGQAFANGAGIGQLLLGNPKAISVRHMVPLAFVSTLFALIVFSLFAAWFGLLFVSVLGMHLGIGIVFSLGSVRENGVKQLVVLPVVFFVLHSCYGVGTAYGVVLSVKGRVLGLASRLLQRVRLKMSH